MYLLGNVSSLTLDIINSLIISLTDGIFYMLYYPRIGFISKFNTGSPTNEILYLLINQSNTNSSLTL